MKFSLAAVSSVLTLSAVAGFCPAGTTSFPVPASASSSAVFISSWGTKGAPSGKVVENPNPEQNAGAFLSSPAPVEARANLDSKVLVSGLVKTRERSDQFVFDLLNNEESAFEWSSIVAFVDDSKLAKKQLISRSARYTGLLDKLDFIQATQAGALPTADQLDGIGSWVVYLEEGDFMAQISEVASVAASAGVEKVAIVVANAFGFDTKAAEDALQGIQEYTLIAVGQLKDDVPDGKIPYGFVDSIEADTAFSRDEAMRLITDSLQLQAGVNKVMSAAEISDPKSLEYKLIKGLRETGYARAQELDFLVKDGLQVRKPKILSKVCNSANTWLLTVFVFSATEIRGSDRDI